MGHARRDVSTSLEKFELLCGRQQLPQWDCDMTEPSDSNTWSIAVGGVVVECDPTVPMWPGGTAGLPPECYRQFLADVLAALVHLYGCELPPPPALTEPYPQPGPQPGPQAGKPAGKPAGHAPPPKP